MFSIVRCVGRVQVLRAVRFVVRVRFNRVRFSGHSCAIVKVCHAITDFADFVGRGVREILSARMMSTSGTGDADL